MAATSEKVLEFGLLLFTHPCSKIVHFQTWFWNGWIKMKIDPFEIVWEILFEWDFTNFLSIYAKLWNFCHLKWIEIMINDDEENWKENCNDSCLRNCSSPCMFLLSNSVKTIIEILLISLKELINYTYMRIPNLHIMSGAFLVEVSNLRKKFEKRFNEIADAQLKRFEISVKFKQKLSCRFVYMSLNISRTPWPISKILLSLWLLILPPDLKRFGRMCDQF